MWSKLFKRNKLSEPLKLLNSNNPFMLKNTSLRLFILVLICVWSHLVEGQNTVAYTMQTANFNQVHTLNTNSNYFAGHFDNGASELGNYANGSGPGYTGDPGVASFRTFTVDGTIQGTIRPLQVGDQFTITAYVNNSSSFFSNSNAGISLNSGTANSQFLDFDSGQRLKMQINQGGNWFGAGQLASAGFCSPGQDVTLTFTITSSQTANLSISGANGASTSELELSGSGAVESMCIWNKASGGNNNMYWKNCSVTSTGTVTLGQNIQANSLTTISGVISDGLFANSATSVKVNNLEKVGSGIITLTGANTYTGTTTISAGTLITSGSGSLGSGSSVNVNLGGTLEIENEITVASLNNDGTVIIKPGGRLNVTGNITNSNIIDVEADNTGYGQIKCGGAVLNTGTGRVKQEQYLSTTAGRHHMISSPMAGGFTTTNGNPSGLYSYDANSASYNLSPSTTNPGIGYFAKVESGGFISGSGVFSVSGTPNTSLTHNLGYSASVASGGSGGGWNLIGNPYTCGLDWGTVSLTNVNNAFYVWNPANSNYNYYANGISTPTNYAGSNITSVIPPMQSFWVQATASGASLATTMTSNGTVASNPTFYKNNPDNLILVVKNIGDSTKADALWIKNVSGKTNDFEGDEDAWKLMNSGGNPNIYTYHSGRKMAINASDLSNFTIVPVGFNAAIPNEKYRITAEQIVNNGTYTMVLEDKLKNVFVNLAESSYSFIDSDWSGESPRFALHIGSTALGAEESNNLRAVKLFKSNEDQLVIQGWSDEFHNYRVQTIDGRVIAQGILQMGTAQMPAPEKGVYIVELSGTKSYVGRVIIP